MVIYIEVINPSLQFSNNLQYLEEPQSPSGISTILGSHQKAKKRYFLKKII